jgi:hypothetical protein
LNALITDEGEGTLGVTVTGGLAPYTYQWSIADNIQAIAIDGSSTSSKVDIILGESVLTYGLVKVVVTDANGCSVNDSFFYYFQPA